MVGFLQAGIFVGLIGIVIMSIIHFKLKKEE